MAHGVFKPRNKRAFNEDDNEYSVRIDPKRTKSTRPSAEIGRKAERFGPEGDLTQWRTSHRNRD